MRPPWWKFCLFQSVHRQILCSYSLASPRNYEIWVDFIHNLRHQNLSYQGLYHCSVHIQLLGLDAEHLVELEGLGDAGRRLLLHRDLPGVRAVHYAVTPGLLFSFVQRATPIIFFTLHSDEENVKSYSPYLTKTWIFWLLSPAPIKEVAGAGGGLFLGELAILELLPCQENLLGNSVRFVQICLTQIWNISSPINKFNKSRAFFQTGGTVEVIKNAACWV